MQMNRQIKGVLILLLLSVVSLVVLAAEMDNPPAEPEQTEAVAETPDDALPQTGDGEPVIQPDAEKPPAGTGAAVKPIKEFKPTEQIEADSAVSFPVDI